MLDIAAVPACVRKNSGQEVPNRDNIRMSNRPINLEFFIGGFMGDSYVLRLVNAEMQYQHLDEGYDDSKPLELMSPTEQEWQVFREQVDRADVWNWEAEYSRPGVCDGTSWRLLLEYPDCKIESSGDNAYPTNDQSSDDSPMKLLCSALSKLLGGRPVH